jgi:D-alanine-D-alanine ligase
MHRNQPASVQFDGGMTLVKASGIAGRKQRRAIDLVFPAMHGTYGEDGALTGLLDMAGIPYVGCGVGASAVAMDKVLTKQVAVANGIAVSKFLAFPKADLERQPGAAVTSIAKTLSYPLFVKPAHLGSSIGITRVTNDTELRHALEVAAHYDDKVIVEEAVNNLIEVTLPIMGNDRPQPALLERPMTEAEDFFDFDTKYIGNGKGGGKKGGGKGANAGYSEVPAKLEQPLYETAEKLGLEVYRLFGCSGIARIDMLIDQKTGEVYLNEINPLPGSLYAHNWNKAGVSNVDLVQKLIAYAKERHTRRQALNTSFSTNFLQQF